MHRFGCWMHRGSNLDIGGERSEGMDGGVRVLLRKGEELGVLVVCYRTACINNPDDLITRGGGALLSD